MKSTIAIINSYPKFDAVFEPVASEMRMNVKRYSGIRPMADDLNAKILTAGELALIVLTGTSEENDAVQYRSKLSLLAQLEKHSKLKAVPVLFLGYMGDNYLSEACAGCGVAYLDLPVRKSVLIGRIRELCDETGSEPQVSPITIDAKIPRKRLGPSAPESERRIATVMFADIAGFTAMSEVMDPEEVTAVMNGVFHEMEEVINANGGTIDKFIGDCVMVLFGVPKALENAPLRAVNTAIDMRNRLHAFNREKNLAVPLDIHIGMNTGPVVAGQVGGRDRKDFTVMGDAVNLASRIEGVSVKGQILVGPDTYRATAGDFEFGTLEPVSLKGKAEPVPVYEVLSVKKAAGVRRCVDQRVKAGADRMIFSEMVGRDKEMNELRHAVTGLIRGRGGIVNVIGEAGIGKSRLMAELKSDPSMKQVTLLEGQTISMGRNLSFHPIIDLLKNWAGIREDDGEADAIAKLDKAVRAVHTYEADEIVPFVATMMGMKLSGKFAERVKGIEGEALEKLIFKNVRELLIRGAELRPMIIRIEDLHWADTSSIELLESLFRLSLDNRILFLNCFRPNYPDTGERISEFVSEEYDDNYTEIRVQPLDGNESTKLISNLLNIKGIPQTVKDRITEQAGGNPFFIEEVVRSLIDEGAVVRKGGSFAVTDRIHEVKVPLTVNEVLMSRIDRLDEETRNLIKTASVIGRYFFYKIITQVAENISDIDSRLGYLENIQLIRERKRLDELEYLFKHALAQEAAYESILIQKRKELHLQVAQAIENVFSGRLHEFYGMLAYHYSMGENLDRAEEYMLRAGEEAMKASASSEALKYFIDATKIYQEIYGNKTDASKVVRIECNIADLYHQKAMGQDAVEHYYRVLTFYGIQRPVEWAFRIKSYFSLIVLLIRLLIPFLKPFTGKKIPEKKIKDILSIKIKQAFSYFSFNEERAALEMALISRIFNKYELSRFDIHVSLLAIGYLVEAFVWAGISLRAGRRLVKLIDQTFGTTPAILIPAYSHADLMYKIFSGRWHEIVQHSEQDILVQSSQLDNINERIHFIYFFALCKLESGEFTFALNIIGKMRELGDVYNNEYAMALWYKIHARILYKKRELSESLDETAMGIDFIRSFGHPDYVGFLYSLKARLLSIMDDSDGAEDALLYAKKQFSSATIVSPYYRCMYSIGWWSLHYKNFNESFRINDKNSVHKHLLNMRKWAHKAVRYSNKCATDSTEACRIMGISFYLSGKYVKAFAWWKKSIDMGTRLGAKPELARTYAEIGMRLGGRYLHVDADPEGGVAHHHARLPRPLVRIHVYAEKRLGLSPEECLDKAEAMFHEMGLEWDLEQLENFRNTAQR